ncbi:MAG: hypothetical protein ACE5EA_03780 [Nitrospirota bacterium]
MDFTTSEILEVLELYEGKLSRTVLRGKRDVSPLPYPVRDVSEMNYLKAVFWDYPQFTDKEYMKKYLQENKDTSLYLWILRRFLEYGRVVDTISYFKIDEISEQLSGLKLTHYTYKKWKRIIDVYGKS